MSQHKLYHLLILFMNLFIFEIVNAQGSGITADNMHPVQSTQDDAGSFSGDMSTTIPLLTVPGRNGLDYTISLNYQSGIKPGGSSGTEDAKSELPSSVGLGFSLNLGSVTRSVVNRPDEQIGSKFIGSTPGYNLGGNAGQADVTDEASGILNYNTQSEGWDIYNLSLPDQGSYRLISVREETPASRRYYFVTDKYKPWIIGYNYNTAFGNMNFNDNPDTGELNNFFVVDDYGKSYVYNHKSNLEINNGLSGNSKRYYKFPISWEITAIHSADYIDQGMIGEDDSDIGSWVKFTYDNYASEPNTRVNLNSRNLNLGNLPTSYGLTGSVNASLLYDYSVIQTIETPTHRATFYSSNRNDVIGTNGISLKKIDRIILRKKGDNTIIKQIDFQYATLASNSDGIWDANEKLIANSLTLISIQEFGVGGTVSKPPITFEYNSNPVRPSHVDFFGFWGEHWNLSKISFPEGGYVKYTYEKDSYNWDFDFTDQTLTHMKSKYYPTPILNGGARLLKKEIYDGMHSTPKTWKYSYGEGVKHNPFPSNEQAYNSNYGAKLASFVGYRSVTVELPDSSGFITNYYTSGVSANADFSLGNPPISLNVAEAFPDVYYLGNPIQKNCNAAKRGIVWQQQYFDKKNNLIKETKLTHQFNIRPSLASAYDPYRESPYSIGLDPGSPPIPQGLNEIYQSYSDLVTKIIETQDGVVNVIDNIYNPWTDLVASSTYTIRDRTSYTSSDTVVNQYKKIMGYLCNNTRNILSVPLLYSSKSISNHYDINLSKNSTTTKIIEGDIPTHDRIYPNTDKFTIYGGYHWPQNGYESSVTSTLYRNYDNYGNLIESKNINGTITSQKWGYNGALLIAQIKNAPTNQVGISIFDDNELSSWSSGSGTWNIVNGTFQQQSTTDISPWTNPKISNDVVLQDGVLEADVRFDNDGLSRYAGLIKYTDINNFIRFELRKSENLVRIQTNKTNGGSYSQDATFLFSENQWYHVKGEVSGTVAKLYIDGTLLITIDHSTVYQVPQKMGLCTKATVASFDNIRYYPNNTLITLQTYDPVTFMMTQESDENGKRIFYEYDGFLRPYRIRNNKNEIVTEFSYYLAGTSINANSPNVVTTLSYRSVNDYTTTKDYFDGLGRKIQNQISLGTEDIVSHSTFDAFGRDIKTFKPFLYSTSHNYLPETQINSYASNYYNQNVYNDWITDNYPYLENKYSPDPLNRIDSVGLPGNAFKLNSGHEIVNQYSSNSSDLETPYWFEEQSLFKTKHLDENKNITIQLYDKTGNNVGTLIDSGGLHYGTYYYRDADGAIREIQNPNNQKTIYEYGIFRKVIQKISPDAGTLKYNYDYNGNLRFVLDAKNQFAYYKYDGLNRIIEVGEYNGTTSFATADPQLSTFPSIDKAISKTFIYDVVVDSRQRNLNGRLSQSISYSTLSTNGFFTQIFSYDDMGRIETIINSGYLNAEQVIEYQYDLQGNITKKIFKNYVNGTPVIHNTLYTFYEYDQAGRLVKVYTNTKDSKSTADGAIKEIEYLFFASGKIKRMQLGNAQGVDYRYNERDWLTQINHQNLNGIYQGVPQDPGGDGYNGIPGDKFGMVFGYNDVSNHIGGAQNAFPQYDGTISWLMYRMAAVSTVGDVVGYTYSYDRANRLVDANFGKWGTSSWLTTSAYDVSSLSYDGNGNILGMTRRDQYGNKSAWLYYSYLNGTNKLSNIWDRENDPTYYYTYDANGNMITDNYRQITNIGYDIFNLPNSITKTGVTTNYAYTADGHRLRKSGGSTDEYSVIGLGGEVEAVFDGTNLKYWNINVDGQTIGRINR